MSNSSNYQNTAVDIEEKLCDVFSCERYGFGGIVNSDQIRRSPYLCMVVGLMYNYKSRDEHTQKNIQKFIENYKFYCNMGIDGIYEKDKEYLKNMVGFFYDLIG